MKTMSKGVYILLIVLPETRLLEVGRLGTFRFHEGAYLYVGSALHNLETRAARHRSKRKKLRWHIDFLLQYADVRDVLTFNTEKRIECMLNRVVCETVPVVTSVKGFGSSDCRCVTHLWRSMVSLSQGRNGWFFNTEQRNCLHRFSEHCRDRGLRT